jgi:hypothetical protein
MDRQTHLFVVRTIPRLSKDYETLTESSEVVIYLAMRHLMVRRLKPCPLRL